MKQRRKIVAIFLISIIFLGSIIYFGNKAEAVTVVKTAKITNSATALATTVIHCPGITSVASCTSDNGTKPVCVISGDDVTVTCDNGTGSPNYIYNITLTYEVVPFIDVKVTYDKLLEDNNHYAWLYGQTTNASVNVDRAYNIAPETNAFYPNNFKVDVEGAGLGGSTPTVTILDKNGFDISDGTLNQKVDVSTVIDSKSVGKYTITATCNGMTKTITVNSAYINTNAAADAHWDRVGFVVTKINNVVISGSQTEKTVDAPNGTISAAGITTLNNLIKATGIIASSYDIAGYLKIKCWFNDAGGNPYGIKYYYLRSELLPEVGYAVDQLGDDCINSFTGWSSTTKNTFDALDPFEMTYKGLVIGVLNQIIMDTDGNNIPGNSSSQITVPFDPATIYNYTAVAPVISGYTLQTGTLQDKDNNPAVTNGSASRSINYSNENQSANIQWIYKKNYIPPANQPPVPIIDLQATCVAGDTVRLSGARSYDSDGTIVKYEWSIQGSPSDMEGKPRGSITFPSPGDFIVMLDVIDDDGATSSTSVRIKVTEAPPVAQLTHSGFLKENRKVIFDAITSRPGSRPIDWSKTTWSIKAEAGGANTDADIRFYPTGGRVNITGHFRKEGTYTVRVTIYNTAGISSSYVDTVKIEPDLPPIATGSVPLTVNRVPADGNMATIIVKNNCSSPDGDPIYVYALLTYDANNNHIFTDDISYGSADGVNFYSTGLTEANAVTMNFRTKATANPATFTYKTNKVGKYQVRLIPIEQIPAAQTNPDLLYGDEQRFTIMNAGILVPDNVNIPPTVTLTAANKKQLDMVVVTDYLGTKRAELENKIDVLKYSLAAQNYDLIVKYVDKVTDYSSGSLFSKTLNFDGKNEIPYSSSYCSINPGIGNGGSNAITGTATNSYNCDFTATVTVPDNAVPAKLSGYLRGYSDRGDTFGLVTMSIDGKIQTATNTLTYFEKLLLPGTHTITVKANFSMVGAGWYGRKDDKEWRPGTATYGTFILDDLKIETTPNKWVGHSDYVTADPNAVQITGGGATEMKLMRDGSVWARGYPDIGQLYTPIGLYNSVDPTLWVQQPGTPANIDRIFSKQSSMFALTKDGTLYCTGDPYFYVYYSWYDAIAWGAYSRYPKPYISWRVLAYGVADVKISAPSAREGQSFAVLFKNGTVAAYVDDNGLAQSVTYPGPFDIPNRETKSFQTSRYYSDGLQGIPGLYGITKIDMNNRLLVAYNGTTKRTYAIGDNTGGVLGWTTTPYSSPDGWTSYGPYERTVKELTVLAGLDIKDVDCTGHRVLTTSGQIFTFGGAYIGTFPYAEKISKLDGNMVQDILGNYISTTGNLTFTDVYTHVPVYAPRLTDIPSMSFRSDAQKIMLYATDGTGNVYIEGFGNHFPMLETNETIKNYISTQKFDNYIVSNSGNYSFKDMLFGRQKFSMMEMFSTMPSSFYETGQVDQAFSAIKARYVNNQAPNRIYYILGEDTVSYNTSYSDYENDPRQAERCKDDHDQYYFENGNGLEPNNGAWQSILPKNFLRLGKHTLTYQAQDNPLNIPSFNPYWLWSNGTNQVEIYVHRRPIANFIVGGSLDKQGSGFLLNNADEAAGLPVTLVGSAAAQGGIGLNGSAAYRVLPGDWRGYAEGSLSTTFTVPASAISAKLGFYLKGDSIAVTIDGVGKAIPGLSTTALNYCEFPISAGTHTLTIFAGHTSYHHKDDDWDYYGWFTMDDIAVAYTTQYKDLAYRSKSYDLDHYSLPNRGIINEEWKWRYPWEAGWRDGRPAAVEMNFPFFVSLRVQDMENAWSYPKIIYVDSNVPSYPVAQYNIRKNPIELSEKLNLTDTSYALKGSLSAWQWVIYKLDANGYIGVKVQDGIYYNHNNGTGELAGYDANVTTNYNSMGKGTYRIFLRVKDTQGYWSDGETDGAYDLGGFFYKDLTVKNSAMLLNFRVSMIRDLFLEGFYKGVSGPNRIYNDVDLNVNSMCIDKETFIGKKGVKSGFNGLTKGYNFEFEIDSLGFNGTDAKVEFTPTFYTISEAGVRSMKPVEIYWKDSKNKFWKAGSGGHSSWKTIVLTSLNRNITGEGTATWRGSYLIPASSFAVPEGTTEASARLLYYGNGFIKEDLLVDFQIDGFLSNEKKYDYNLSRWNLERTIQKPPYVVGDVIRYNWKSNCLYQIKTRRIF